MFKLSIVTVCYNEEASIEATILSVLNQTYKNIEYIIVDGGSKDATLSIVDKYKCSLYRVISEPDEGIYDAMNKGLDIASGDYVAFMNAGDVYFSCDSVGDLFKRDMPDVDIFFGNTVSDYRYKQVVRKASPFLLDSVKPMTNMPCCHQSMFLKLSLAKKEKFDLRYKIAADFHMLCKLHNANKLSYIYSDSVVSKISVDGVSDLHRIPMFKEKHTIFNEVFGWRLDRNISYFYNVSTELFKLRLRPLVRKCKF